MTWLAAGALATQVRLDLASIGFVAILREGIDYALQMGQLSSLGDVALDSETAAFLDPLEHWVVREASQSFILPLSSGGSFCTMSRLGDPWIAPRARPLVEENPRSP